MFAEIITDGRVHPNSNSIGSSAHPPDHPTARAKRIRIAAKHPIAGFHSCEEGLESKAWIKGFLHGTVVAPSLTRIADDVRASLVQETQVRNYQED